MELEKLMDALKRYYADTGRTREETRDGLEEFRDYLDALIDSLEN